MENITKQEHIDGGDYVRSYNNGDYSWGKNGVAHLVRDGKEIARGDGVWSYENGDYSWTKNGVAHLVKKSETKVI